MSATPHHHPSTESKPVSFTVPMILGMVTLLAVFLFLKLCDPKPHGAGHGHEHGAAANTHESQAGHKHATEENAGSHETIDGDKAGQATEHH